MLSTKQVAWEGSSTHRDVVAVILMPPNGHFCVPGKDPWDPWDQQDRLAKAGRFKP